MDHQENTQYPDMPEMDIPAEDIPAEAPAEEVIVPEAHPAEEAPVTEPAEDSLETLLEQADALIGELSAGIGEESPELPEETEKPELTEETQVLPVVEETAAFSLPEELAVEQIILETLAEQKSDPETLPADATQVLEQPFRDTEYRDAFEDGEELEAMFAPEGDKKPARQGERKPVRQRRSAKAPAERTRASSKPEPSAPAAPEKKKRPLYRGKDNIFGLSHILVTAVWLAIIVFIGVTLANILWVCASEVLAFGREDREITVSIEETDSLQDISQKLKDVGLIRYPKLFAFYAQFTDAREEIGAGTFTLNTMYDYHALVSFMNSGSAELEVVEVVIPEGYSCAQLFALLEEKGVCTVAEMEDYAATGELDEYWFLEDVERGDRYCLEGFLFPDTYEFYVGDEPRRVLEKMLDDFDYRFTDEMRSDLIELNSRITAWMEDEGYDQEYIDSHHLTLRELVIVASLIEKETANTLESYTISSVIYNRLYRWGDTPSFLNIDAAILYALGEHKEELTFTDLQVDSPYNTYTHTGLTPGPICNPGLHSLNAALDPDDTGYYYYAMDPDEGVHHFSRNEDDHNAFLESLEEE